jgi:glucose/arabinose dehydrogenase
VSVVACALTAALLGTACSGPTSRPSADTRTAGPAAAGSAPASSPTRAGQLRVSEFAGGLTTPWGLVALPDGTLLVGERDTGQILRVGGTDRTVLTTLHDVVPGGEGGLLGLVLTPDRSRLLAYLTAARDNQIVALPWDGSRLGQPQTLRTGIPKGLRHDGGRMVVGPDGYLYVGTGETGQPDLAQDKSSPGGKILRLTLDGKAAPGDPFGTEVWSYGHRNVEGLAFDEAGRLWASEFGDSSWDELNLITRGGNYGWPTVEGSGSEPGLINPKVVWRTDEASPSGLAYWQGELWMAALQGGRLWEIPLDGSEPGTPIAHYTSTYGRLRSVIVSADGSSLLVTVSNTDGRGQPKPGDDKILRISR